MLSVQNNMQAKNANRQLNVNTKKNAQIAEKLSSGYKINRAADDAAGLAISEKMRRQIRGLHQGAENIKDGIGYVQTAEGALNEVHDMLQRINELAVKAANGTNTVSDRAAINSEVQALKTELNRIFGTTSFNEQKIWEPGFWVTEGGAPVSPPSSPPSEGVITKQAATFQRGTNNGNTAATNANCGVTAMSNYLIHADEENGVYISWTGYDGKQYETDVFSWDYLKEHDYTLTIAPEDDDGNVLFSYSVSMTVAEEATIKDIVKAIDGVYIYSFANVSSSAEFVNPTEHAGVRIGSAYIRYEAAYASHMAQESEYDFDSSGNETFIEPNYNSDNGNLWEYPTEDSPDTKWQFSFDMPGIGTVTATSAYCSYTSNDTADWENRDKWSDDDKDIWWEEYTTSSGEIDRRRKSYDNVSPSLSGILAALTGAKGTDTPGLLTSGNGGASDSGGTITLRFDLESDPAYTYGGNRSDTDVGYFYISIDVYPDDTVDKVLGRIREALNGNTVIDIDSSSDSRSIYEYPTPNTSLIEVPVHGEGDDEGGSSGDSVGGSGESTYWVQGRKYFWVQAGAEAGQHIDIAYDSLSLNVLGISETNTMTAEDAEKAIDEIKGAIQIVSDQRSLFGAYQNRLEHAYNINLNVEENTQASESLIRDTDVADMMMEYSINNILLQSGTSMLTQANQSTQLILELLG